MRALGATARAGFALAILAVVAACQAGNSSTSPAASVAEAQPATSAPSGPAVTSSAATRSLCVDDRTPGDTSHTTGTLLGKIDQGRILFGLEGAGTAAGGTFAFGIIDPGGFHAVATDDWTMANAIWTPDGAIVFDSSRNDDRHLFRMAADGTGVTQLTSDFRAAEASAAFIGKDRLVFDHFGCLTPPDLGLYTAAADGSALTDLTPGFPNGETEDDTAPTASPDQKTVVFIRYVDPDDTVGGLWEIPAAGGTATRLTPDAKGILYPRFSPDGKTVLFTEEDASGDDALYVEPASGGTPRVLTSLRAGSAVFEADWSPDGSEIVAKEHPQGQAFNELHVFRADGTGDQILWRGKMSTAETPDWDR